MSARLSVFGIFSLLLAACASAPPPPPSAAAPQVKVVITTDSAVKYYVDTAALTLATEDALRRYASGAKPATIAVRFVSVGPAFDVHSNIDVRSYPEEMPQYGPLAVVVQNVPSTGEQRAVYAAPSARSTPVTALGDYSVVRGTYTITDEQGFVLERKQIYVRANSGEGITPQPNDHVWAAKYLAKRVAKLRRNG